MKKSGQKATLMYRIPQKDKFELNNPRPLAKNTFPVGSKMRGLCSCPNDPVALHADAWGLKKLFTYGVRKSGADKLAEGSPHRRVPRIVK